MVNPHRIKKARGIRTQRQYAQDVGVDQVMVSRWERGDAQPGLDSLAKLAQEAGEPIEWFLHEVKRPR